MFKALMTAVAAFLFTTAAHAATFTINDIDTSNGVAFDGTIDFTGYVAGDDILFFDPVSGDNLQFDLATGGAYQMSAILGPDALLEFSGATVDIQNFDTRVGGGFTQETDDPFLFASAWNFDFLVTTSVASVAFNDLPVGLSTVDFLIRFNPFGAGSTGIVDYSATPIPVGPAGILFLSGALGLGFSMRRKRSESY